jgi:PAS domain S-box-containing protein
MISDRPPCRVLQIDGDAGNVRRIAELLRAATVRFEVENAGRLADGIDRLEKADFDVVLLQLRLPDSQGLAALARVQALTPDVPVVVMAGTDDADLALRAVQAGAQDHIVNGELHGDIVARSIRYAIEHKRAEARIRRLNTALAAVRSVDRLIVRETNPDRLMQGACERMVARGVAVATWIARAGSGQRLELAAFASVGGSEPALRGMLERGEIPDCCRKATETSDVEVEATCSDCPAACGSLRHAVLAVPLRYAGHRGFLVTVLAGGIESSAEEQQLVRELAGDLAHALESLAERERLKESQAHLAASQRIARVGSWELDLAPPGELNQNPLRGSDEAYRVFGYEPGEIEASHEAFWARVHPDDKAKIQEAVRRALDSRSVYEVEHRVVLPGSSERIVHERAEIVEDPTTGRVLKFVGTSQDVTERKRVEVELRKLTEAVGQASTSIVITDRAGNIEYVNRAFTTTTGYTAEEAHGLNPRVLKSGKTSPETYRQMWETITAGGTWQGELCNRKKNGELFWEEAVVSPVRDAGGAITHFIANKLDVTHSRDLEQRFLQAQKMEAVGRLAGGVAHDFNNLLGVITGYAELLKGQIDERHPGRSRIEHILTAAQRAAGLTRQLLAFSRKQVLEPRVLDPNAVVAGVEMMLRRLIGEDVDLVLKLDATVGTVKADPGQIEQVLMNLAVNARDAMPAGGILALETAGVDLDESYARFYPGATAGPHVVLAVSDTGVGMDATTLAHAFEPFFTTKEEGKGTGLGLSTVYGIIQQSGGFVSAYSELGRGTTFRVYLPRIGNPAVEEEGAPAAAAPRAIGSETILLVEDDSALRAVIAETLVAGGYSVLEAPGPEQGLALAQSHSQPIHLLLTDVVMPGTNGRELADQIIGLHAETGVVFMSGYSGEIITRTRTLDHGVLYLQKPFGTGELLTKIRGALDRQG